MYGLGTIINTGAIVAGGLAGILFGRFLKENVQDTLSKCCGVSTLMIGIAGALEKMLTMENGAISGGGSMLLVLCLTVGGVIGELLNLEGAFECFGRWLKEKTGNAKDKGFVTAFVTASLTVCIGAMAIVGSLDAGLRGDYGTILTKSLIDGITAAMLASTLGVGVLFSAAAVFLYQSAITLLAGVLQPLLSDAIIAEMSAVGGLLIFAVGLNMQGVTKIRVGNLLPAIFVPMAYLPIQDWLQGLFH